MPIKLITHHNWLANHGIKGNAMKVKTTVHIYHSQYSWETKAKFQVYSLKIDDTEHMTYVGSQEIEIDVPDSYDPTAQKIAALEEHKKKVMADYQKTVDQINERISKLQAIEYTP
jgi:poly(3-hydroxybutyrate) depolymerase